MSSDLHFLQGKNLKDANIAVSAGKIYLDTATNELWYDDPSGDITDKHIRLFNNATKTTDGLMSAEDKRKVNYTNVSYGTCTTAENVANKVVSFSTDENEWSLTVGAMITVLFSYTNTANNPTLNVNGTGAKAIYYNTSKVTTSNLNYGGYKNRLITYIYDGTAYRFVSWGNDNNTKNTAGATNDVTNKLFLIGAREQNTDPRTYTNVNTYVSENHLFSNDSQVLNQSELVSTAKSTIASNTASTTSDRTYPIEYDKNGKLSVNVPWANTWRANTATQAGYIAAPGANVANKVWKTDSTGTPGWRDDADTNTDTWQANTVTQDGYVTAPTTSNANKVWKTNADGVPGWRTDSNTWTPNTASNAGYVAAGTGNANKVWKTDADGVPGWRADADTNTKNTAGTYNKADTKLFIVGSTAQSTSSSGSSATNTNSSVYVGTDNNLYDSRGLVASAASISSLSTAMIFRGTVGTNGTVTALPTASSAVEGDTYKVITAGTYANQVAKIGDVFVCCKPTGATTYGWILIPSGDEPSGTVTSIATADGITGGTITSSGTLKANLVSYTKNDAAATSSSSDKLYAVQLDKDGKLAIAMEAADKADMATYAKYIRITPTNPSTATTYNIPFVTSATANTNYEPRGNNGFRYRTLEGTTNAEGQSRLYLGNSTATGTAGNKSGGILIYSSGASYQLLLTHPSAANGSTAASSRTTYLRDYGTTGYLVATTTRDAVGSTTKPVYISTSGVATAGSTYAGGTKVTLNGAAKGATTASFYAPTSAGTVGQVLVSSGGAPSWSPIAYIKKTSSSISGNRTVAGDISALYIYGNTYGNTASNLATAGQFSYGDPGPQIIFNTSAGGSQAAALIFTDNDSIAEGASLSLVSNQPNVSFIAPTIKALTKFIGALEGNASSATYATSAGKISDITENDKASSSATKRRIWFCYDNNTTGRPAYDDRFTIQTSTGTLFAPTFSGSLSGNASSATKLATARTIFGHSFNGTANVAGQPLVYGSYNSDAASRYGTGGIQIRENGLVSNAQSDIAYAPAIGFHWSGRIAASLLFHSDGIFYFRKQNFTDRATIDANVHGNATTCEYPAGFASRTTGATWGNTTGTSITSWNDSTGGSVDWRRDNPSSGKISMKVDGRVYVNEGNNPVLSSEHANGYWGMCTPDGANNEWIRTTSLGIIPYAAGGHGSIGTSSWPFNEGYFKYLNVTNDASNTENDALAYFRHYNNNGWTVKVDSGSYDYGLYVINAHTATNALQVTGGARISNTLRIGNGTALDGNYCEGIRIRAANSAQATIILGATADTGTNKYAWSIHRKADNNFCISRNSSDGGNGLVIKTDGCIGIGNTNPGYRLTVNGTGYFGNLLTVQTGATHGGIKMGNTYVSSIDGSVIFQNNTAIRFGGDNWDWNNWAGLRYDHGSKTIYLGLADNSIFTANAAQSEGVLALPGVHYFNINGKEAIAAYDDWLRINQNSTFIYGIYFGSSLARTDEQFQVGNGGSKFYAKNNGNGYFSNNLTVGRQINAQGFLSSANYGTSAPGSSTSGSGVAGAIYFQII